MRDGEQGSITQSPHEPAQAGSDVDVQRLADKVYRLLANEIRIGLARGEQGPGRSSAGRSS